MKPKPLLSSRSQITKYSEFYALYPELANEDNPEWLSILERAQLSEAPYWSVKNVRQLKTRTSFSKGLYHIYSVNVSER